MSRSIVERNQDVDRRTEFGRVPTSLGQTAIWSAEGGLGRGSRGVTHHSLVAAVSPCSDLHHRTLGARSEDQRLAGPDPAAAAGSSLSERRSREENPDEYIIVRLPNLEL